MQLGEAWEEAAAAASIVVSLFFICPDDGWGKWGGNLARREIFLFYPTENIYVRRHYY